MLLPSSQGARVCPSALYKGLASALLVSISFHLISLKHYPVYIFVPAIKEDMPGVTWLCLDSEL